MTRVTEKQEKFLKNIVYKGMSQREAYRDAYENTRMKDKSVDECACKLMKNTKVSTRFEELRREKEGIDFFGLSEKEEKFVESLILGQSQRVAYKNAYNCRNFSDKTVDEKACRLFKTDKIQARFKQLRNQIVQNMEKDAVMQGQEILKELTRIARSNLGDVLNVEMNNRGKVKIGLKENFDIRNVKEMYIDKNGQLRIKMYSPIDAMSKLADLQNVAKENATDNQIVVEIDKELWELSE